MVVPTPESGERAGYDGYKRRKGSKIHIAVDTLGLLLAAHVTPTNEQERAQVKELAEAVQEVRKILSSLLSSIKDIQATIQKMKQKRQASN